MQERKGDDRSRDLRGWLFDVAVAVIAAGISLSVFATLSERADSGVRTAVATLLAVHSAALVGRRRWPAATLAVTLATGLGVLAFGWPSVTLGLAIVVAVYSAGAELPRRPSIAALAATEATVVVAAFIESSQADMSTRVGNMAVLAVAWFIGSTMRARRDYAANLERRNRELEVAREELAQKAVAEERVRIARELHDIIAHNMSVIAVHAGAGRRVIDSDPVEAKRSLAVIEDTSRSALGEVRRVLGLLRDEDEAHALAPAPSLGDLEGLIERVTASGVEVEMRRSGELSNLSQGVQLTVYRIVQEALTNVIKHSAARRRRVVIARDDGSVRVEVVDDGSGPSRSAGEGSGLRGMRERVDAYGGEFAASGMPEGGFRVSASIPVEAGS